MDYDLYKLGETNFEHLSQALALRVFGAGARVFGRGPDGGREVTFEGKLNYPVPSPKGPWCGYGILQAKYKTRAEGTTRDTDWFCAQVERELREWCSPQSRRVRDGRTPEYLLFTTNVALSAVPALGGVDKVHDLVSRYADKIGLKGWDFWYYDQLRAYLEAYRDIRKTYAAFITPNDAIAAVLERIDGESGDVATAITTHAIRELISQQDVRLGTLRDAKEGSLPLSEVAIDLPAECWVGPGDERPRLRTIDGLAAHVIALGDTLRPHGEGNDYRLVIVGGPGQGKTTIGQLLCQVYRAEFLADRSSREIGQETVELRDATHAVINRLILSRPACRRWPVSVSLTAYADALARTPNLSLIQHITNEVNARTDEVLTVKQMKRCLTRWAWLVLLDGLDEVAAPAAREDVRKKIAEFLADAALNQANTLTIITTRPQGYGEEFAPQRYDHLTLRQLRSDEAVGYANLLASARFPRNAELRAKVVHRVTQATEEPSTARLMRSPLQISIMSVLLESRLTAPKGRHNLFEEYYRTVFAREVAKEIPLGSLLAAHSTHIDAIHGRVGLYLNSRLPEPGEAQALLTEGEFENIVEERLLKEEFGVAQVRELVPQLLKATTDRLVLLVKPRVDRIGFEVRSLQEFMAARSISGSGDRELLDKLRRLAPDPLWRNTWLFAAGMLFERREHLRDSLITMLSDIDADSRSTNPAARILTLGADLALDLLDEDIAAQSPRYVRQLVEKATAILRHFPGDSIAHAAGVLFDAASREEQARDSVWDAVGQALTSRGRPALSAMQMLAAWGDRTGDIARRARVRLARAVREIPREMEIPAAILASKPIIGADALRDLARCDVTTEEELDVSRLLQHVPTEHSVLIRSMLSRVMTKGEIVTFYPAVIRQLQTASAQNALAEFIESVPLELWPEAAAIQGALFRARGRLFAVSDVDFLFTD